ncbi:MAG: hypothetical protein JWR84_1342 [Caulobacter sp.]|nr:hypothetical protein [Caulobacter sp.]
MRWPDDYRDPASVRFPEDRWDAKFKGRIPEAEQHPDRLKAIVLIEPPDVPTSRGELDAVLAKHLASDFAARLQDIKAENKKAPPSLFLPLNAHEEGPNKETFKVVDSAIDWSLPYIMYFKARWMRARPDHLDPDIKTVFAVPGHPAYPSGHSTQAHLMALIGYEICRDRAIGATLWAAADRIAENREYAGVHYRADSACGVELARQLLPFFIEDNKAKILAAQKAEWP